MPKPLLDRLRPDSIAEFRLAAQQRFVDGEIAAAAERRTAAIYLWGYAAEMVLKAAYFRASGFLDRRPVTMIDLRDAVDFGLKAQIFWPRQGQLHNLRAWAEVLVVRRNRTPGRTYLTARFGQKVVRSGQILGGLWNETLRYHKNVAHPHELRRFQTTTEWLLAHQQDL